MADITIEQALYRRRGADAPELLAHSPEFREAWQAEAEWLVTGFGERPPGVACPAAVYAQPLGKEHVAVVQVADRGDGAPGTTLHYHLLVLPRAAYTKFLGDPFTVAERLPPPWDDRSPLAVRTLPAEPLPPRTVREVQQVLQRTKVAALPEDVDPPTAAEAGELHLDNAESPALLGGAQVLVDGGKVVFERPRPDTGLLQGLWTLLPTSTRCHLWPASFAFSNALGFDAVVTPRARPADFPGYTREDQAAEYPEGQYERRLQTAAEAGDQAELDALFSRRSVRETWRLGVALLAGLAALVLALRVWNPETAPPRDPPDVTRKKAAIVAGLVGSDQPLHTAGVVWVAQPTWNALAKQEPAGR